MLVSGGRLTMTSALFESNILTGTGDTMSSFIQCHCSHDHHTIGKMIGFTSNYGGLIVFIACAKL